MDCFICKTSLTIKSMSTHFKLIHGLLENDSYRCTFGNECFQYLMSLSSLKRHFKMHLQRELSKSTSPTSIDISECDAYSQTPSVSSFSITPRVSNDPPINIIQSSSSEQSPIDNALPLNISENGVLFALQLHNNNNFNRNDVLSIQSCVMQNIVEPILTKVQHILKTSLSLNIEQEILLSSMFQNIENPFQSCATEYTLYEWLKKNEYISNFEEFTINNEIEPVHCRGKIKYDAVETTGVMLPISFQFKKSFENNDQLLISLKEMERISNNTEQFTHFIQGSLWREKSMSYIKKKQIVIPFFLYIDDAEVNNPLGSHCNPVTFIYYSFPVIENCEINLAALFKGRDYKQFGNEKCLYSLIREIRKLEENGITIKTSEGEKTVYFVLGLVLGDNLGLNTILGFVSSFSANYFCRFCKTVKTSTQKECFINPSLIRNKENYTKDVSINDVSLTGIKELSILNSIPTFHVTQNFSVDAMHDIFEGVCHYDMCHIIKKLIEMQYFSLDLLNERKSMFNYGEIEIGNISPEISYNHLTKCHLKMSAREMMSFVSLFPLMVGDLVAQDDEVWLFLINLLDIIKIVTCTDIPRDLAERLKYLITRHNSNYIKLFNDSLKPKHHLLMHYYSVVLKSGPPRNFWCFRFEAKHKEFKAYARTITSRKNICVSLAKKFQFKYAYSLIEKPAMHILRVQQCHKINSNQNELIQKFCKEYQFNDSFISYTECFYRSKQFKRGYFVCQYFDINIENAIIFEICEIIEFTGQNVLYVLSKLVKINKYSKHFGAYEVCLNARNEENEYKLLPISKFVGPPINSHKTARGVQMIQPIQYC